jgi:hypothetical protein
MAIQEINQLAYNFVTKERLSLYRNKSSPSDHQLFPTPKEYLGYHIYTDDREVETHAYVQNTVRETSFCNITNASAVAATG